MPRTRTPREKRRSAHVNVRLLPRQRRKLKRAARAAGITVSAYMSTLIDGRRHRITVEPPADLVPVPLLAHWQRTGNNINQIARAAHRGRSPEADWMLGAMKELLALMIDDQITRRHALKFGARRLARQFGMA